MGPCARTIDFDLANEPLSNVIDRNEKARACIRAHLVAVFGIRGNIRTAPRLSSAD